MAGMGFALHATSIPTPSIYAIGTLFALLPLYSYRRTVLVQQRTILVHNILPYESTTYANCCESFSTTRTNLVHFTVRSFL